MSEWDKEDRGGYKSNNCRETVIEALREKQYQSLRHLVKNTGLNADEIEPILQIDSEISFKMVGSISVYFLRINEPKSQLYNSGYNSFLLKDVAENPPAEKRPVRKQSSKKASPTQDKLDLAIIEQCGFEGKTLKETAEILGVPEKSLPFYLYSKAYPQFGAAYQNGKQRRKSQKKKRFTRMLSDD